MHPSTISHFDRKSGMAFLKDPFFLLTVILLPVVFAVQFIAITGIFWSRSHFGTRFNAKIYSALQEKLSSASVAETFGLKQAEEARNAAKISVDDHVTLTMQRAELERSYSRELNRGKDEEIFLARRKADDLVQQADPWLKSGSDQGLEMLKEALRLCPDHFAATKRLALFYEQKKDYPSARFQWEKAAAIVPPQSQFMEEVRENLLRLSKLDTGKSAATLKNFESAPVTSLKMQPSFTLTEANMVSLIRVVRTDLPLQELYDLRFNLDVSISSRTSESSIDVSQLRIEVIFYDQSTTAEGTLIPIKLPSMTIQPKTWTPGIEQSVPLEYSVPRGYFQKRAQNFGSSYAFCGYIVRAYYRGILQDVLAQPIEVLEKYARTSIVNRTDKP